MTDKELDAWRDESDGISGRVGKWGRNLRGRADEIDGVRYFSRGGHCGGAEERWNGTAV